MTAPNDWVQQFIDALHELEDHGRADRLLEQYAPDASHRTLAHSEPFTGRDAIAGFWEHYRRQFSRIHSTFDRVIATEEDAALEWHADGELPDGTPITYRGVTLLHHGPNGLTDFASYYDPTPFQQALGATAS
jgi:ketosteroid isomerase-like protein